MKTIIELPYLPDPDLNPNTRLNYYAKASSIKNAKEVMEYTLKTIDLPKKPYEYAVLKIEFIAKDRIRRDLDNLMASCKAYIDAFVTGGIIQDDTGIRLSHIEGHYRIEKEAKTIFTITKKKFNDGS